MLAEWGNLQGLRHGSRCRWAEIVDGQPDVHPDVGEHMAQDASLLDEWVAVQEREVGSRWLCLPEEAGQVRWITAMELDIAVTEANMQLDGLAVLDRCIEPESEQGLVVEAIPARCRT